MANAQKEVAGRDIVTDLSELIEKSYNGKSLSVYKGDWKRKLKAVTKEMGYKLLEADSDYFEFLNFAKPTNSSVSRSTSSNYKLTDSEKKLIVDLYNGISTSSKWSLSTGKFVDDQMKQLAKESVYEHPVHSMILDPDDPTWKKYFTDTELNEIRHYSPPKLPNIPDDLQEYLNTYDQNWNSGKELYIFADDQKHDPVTEFDKKWIRESMVRMSELFLYSDRLQLSNASEDDLLHDVWPFVYRAFKDRDAKALLGERASGAVALAKNEERGLEARNKRSRKAIGDKLDILFKICFNEHGVCEVGKDNVTIVDDKYLDDGLTKLPKILRDMLSLLVQTNPYKINNLTTVGFLVMGKLKLQPGIF